MHILNPNFGVPRDTHTNTNIISIIAITKLRHNHAPWVSAHTHRATLQGKYINAATLVFRGLRTTENVMQLISNLLTFVSMLWITGLSPAACKADPISCRLWAEPQMPGLYINGDFVIGGIFSIHYYTRSEQNSYTRQPLQPQCSGRSVCECGAE